MTYVLAECDIISEVLFNAEHKSGFRLLLSRLVNRYLQLKLLIKNCLKFFFLSENFFPPSRQVISMHFLTQFANIVLLYAISITVFEIFLKNWKKVLKMY